MQIRLRGRRHGAAHARVSYAKVAATCVLILAVGGGSALAASTSRAPKRKPKHHHYLITSTSQIKPTVLSQLHGANGTNGTNGAKGAVGATGQAGAAGATGPTGPAGPFPASLPSGKTLTGVYTVEFQAAGAASFNANAYSYVFPLGTAPAVNYIPNGGTPPAQCPGTVAAPAAASGNLCVYEHAASNLAGGGGGFIIADPATNVGSSSGKLGFSVQIQSAALGLTYSNGTWAVTG